MTGDLKSVREKIAGELSGLLSARKTLNSGRARVHARRAAGMALAYWRQQQPGHPTSLSFLGELQSVIHNPTFPEEVRLAAQRLVTPIAAPGAEAITLDPFHDARIIIQFLEVSLSVELMPEN